MAKDREANGDQTEEEAKAIWRELGFAESAGYVPGKELTEDSPKPVAKLHTGVMVGLGGFFVLNVAMLLSLPPVLRGRGAPYLPTFQKNLNTMFSLLRKDPAFSQRIKAGEKLQFIDLGSGDGRIVFRAAKERMFHKSIGVEINPLLHMAALAQKVARGPQYWTSTSFHLQDIWITSLHSTHVVAVYGLAPIMDKLGTKLKEELKPGSIVLSNVFAIPGWKHSNNDSGIFLYRTPECWE